MYRNILIPVAPDHRGSASEALNVAHKLAQEGARFTALTIVEAIPSNVALYLPEGQIEKTKGEALASLRSAISEHKDVSTIVVSGHSGRTILEYASENSIDCIVIASHRPGLQDYFLGSTASRVVRHATCAVHIIR